MGHKISAIEAGVEGRGTCLNAPFLQENPLRYSPFFLIKQAQKEEAKAIISFISWALKEKAVKECVNSFCPVPCRLNNPPHPGPGRTKSPNSVSNKVLGRWHEK